MGGLIKVFLIVIGLAALVGLGGYFVLKRGDIPYETLASRYESADSHYVDLPGGLHVHYREQGAPNAPTILLIHGYSVATQTWDQWAGRLKDDYHVVSLDLPGHGLTRAPAGYHAAIETFRDTVAAFAHAKGLSHFAIAGNSMGGNVAWEYALAHPDEVDALILVDSAGWPPSAASAANEPAFFKLLRNPVLSPLLRDLDNASFFRKGLQAAYADPARADDALVTRYVELSRAPGHRDILIQLMLGARTRNFATPERLAAIKAPTLILVGDQDHLIPPADAEKFHAAISGSELISYAGVGHMPQDEHAEESATAVSEFLYRVYEGSALAAE